MRQSIEDLFREAREKGFLTPHQEAMVEKICAGSAALAAEEHAVLSRLTKAVESGEILASRSKRFRNVMEERVLEAVVAKIAESDPSLRPKLDLGDIAAYALNRLPPLYATSEEGSGFQRAHATAEFEGLINERVNEAFRRAVERPEFHPERSALRQVDGEAVLVDLEKLLDLYAANFSPR